MATKQSIVSRDKLLGAFCGYSCGKMNFVQVRKDDTAANTAGDAVRAFLDQRVNELKDYEPIGSHGGLIAFRHPPALPLPPPVDVRPRPPRSELCVYNPITGQGVSLTPGKISDESFVLLANGDGQFLLHVFNLELVENHGVLQIQTYSSSAGRWGGVVGTYSGLPVESPARFLRPTPILLDGVAYFLCESDSDSLGLHALAIPIAGQARQPAPIRLPAKVQHRHTKRPFKADELLLASSRLHGKRMLTLAVAKGFTVDLWTLDCAGLVDEPARWTRRRFVDLLKMKVLKQGCPPLLSRDGDRVKLECFSESSGAVLFHLYAHMLYKLDLQTCKVSLVAVYCKRGSTNICAYDVVDGPAMLKC